ncbi:Phloem protein [Parasponia andersonii]|uniref:Phloem protein n=1 Tax=Parasponia andersonii TaxID=3476 RepID=A0A2P5CRX1_PARAD|nr:Phloem protein [Parasponia andersonii]
MGITQLPEECIALIMSLTSPRDACRSSVVSPLFRSVADSDVVWEKFLPPDYRNVISQSVVFPVTTLNAMPKKSLYFHLCDNPLIIGDGNMSFSLDKPSGKKCYMVGARGLSITWGDIPRYWIWTPLPESRFLKVARLHLVWWLHVVANVETRILSPQTTYAAFLVFKIEQDERGFNRKPVQLCVNFEGQEDGGERSVFLNPSRDMPQLAQDRGNGWKETEMGEFFNENGEDGVVSCILKELSCSSTWSGLIVEGIELRPRAA